AVHNNWILIFTLIKMIELVVNPKASKIKCSLSKI
ncbi:MAG: hypothetical protein ACI8VT_003603, partial [Saprospiraceae bacterium]